MTMYHMKGRFSRGVWRNCGIKAVEILQQAAAGGNSSLSSLLMWTGCKL
jgi:hypothetical protein